MKIFQVRSYRLRQALVGTAETVVGYLNAYTLSGNEEYLGLSLAAWKFISDHIIDRQNGEWYWSVDKNLQPNLKEDKAGFGNARIMIPGCAWK